MTKNIISYTFYLIGLVSLIIGLPMFSMGYYKKSNSNVSFNVAYDVVEAKIISPYKAKFNHSGNEVTCRYLTEYDSSCSSQYSCTQYRIYHYPIETKIALLYYPETGYCRTQKLSYNLLIAGSVFMGIMVTSCILSCISCYFEDNNYTIFPSNDYKIIKIYGYNDNCPVCNEKMENNEVYALKQCGHCYHKKCIITSLNNNDICPICRKVQRV